ncbi:MAG: hypothetical protein M3Z84_02725 [Actinomycetota bacterium]|nr:hypothetical protein [Actinomycetota bacterium]
MSGRRTSFGKLERERTKKAKAVAKREQRQARSEDSDDGLEDATNGNRSSGEVEMPAEKVLELVDQLHQRFDAKLIDYDSFEEQKADLLGRLRVD